MNNRIYKFRAWDKEERKWKLGYKELGGFHLLGELNLLGEVNAELASPLSKLQDIEIMQYTGFEDESGKEIYEGDIVKTPSFIESVAFFDGSYFTVGKHGKKETSHFLTPGSYYKVIGNVWENPELLKEIRNEKI